jgi:hypothetical protein
MSNPPCTGYPGTGKTCTEVHAFSGRLSASRHAGPGMPGPYTRRLGFCRGKASLARESRGNTLSKLRKSVLNRPAGE